MFLPFVVQPGVEPGFSEPKSDVIPIYHWTITAFSQKRLQNYNIYLKPQNFSEKIFIKIPSAMLCT